MGRRLKCLVFIVAKFNQYVSGWWFQIFLIFTPPWGNDPIWRAYFSDWLVQPPTRYRVECISTISHIVWRCPEKWPIDFIARCSGVRYHGKRSLLCGWRNSGCKCFAKKWSQVSNEICSARGFFFCQNTCHSSLVSVLVTCLDLGFGVKLRFHWNLWDP